MFNMEDLKNRIIQCLNIKSHSLNTLHRDISYVSFEDLRVALEELICEGKVRIEEKDPANPQTEDRYFII